MDPIFHARHDSVQRSATASYQLTVTISQQGRNAVIQLWSVDFISTMCLGNFVVNGNKTEFF